MMLFERIGSFFGIVLHIAADPLNIIILFGSVLMGIIFGAMPGLTSTLGVAILTALTYGMDTSLAMVCPHCGQPAKAGRKFCSNCGTRLAG